MQTTLSTAEAQEKFSDLINEVAHNKQQVILTRRGKEIAVLIPVEDFQLLQGIKNKHDLQEATEALKEAREEGSIPLEQIIEELGS